MNPGCGVPFGSGEKAGYWGGLFPVIKQSVTLGVRVSGCHTGCDAPWGVAHKRVLLMPGISGGR